MDNDFIYNVHFILHCLNLILILVIVFLIRFNLGYPLYFQISIMGFSKYSSFYKDGVSLNTKKGTGYVIQKVKTRDFNNLDFNLNINIQNGNFSGYLLDKNKNSIISFKNENIKKTLKVDKNEIYYLIVG